VDRGDFEDGETDAAAGALDMIGDQFVGDGSRAEMRPVRGSNHAVRHHDVPDRDRTQCLHRYLPAPF